MTDDQNTPEGDPFSYIPNTEIIDSKYDYLFKILLLGNSNVGKSSIFLRFVEDKWNDVFVPTIGIDFKIKTFKLKNKVIKMQIWDTAGQERFKNIISTYYRGAHGILLMYDVTDYDSFKNLSNWIIDIEKNESKNVIKILIGNKMDLEDKRQVSFIKGKELADEYGMQFLETSVKLNQNVQEAFYTLSEEIMKIQEMKPQTNNQNKGSKTISIGLNLEEEEENKKSGCCG